MSEKEFEDFCRLSLDTACIIQEAERIVLRDKMEKDIAEIMKYLEGGNNNENT